MENEGTATVATPVTQPSSEIVTGGNGSYTAEVLPPQVTPANITLSPERIQFDQLVPDEFKQAEWVQNVSKTGAPVKELFKKVDNLEKMIGNRQTGIPGPDATPEQLKEFHKSLGVSENVEDYKTPTVQWSAEDADVGSFINNAKSPELTKEMAIEAQKLGLTPKQFAGLSEAYDKSTAKIHKDIYRQAIKQQADLKSRDEEFDSLLEKQFGNRKQVVLDNGAKMLQQFVSPELRSNLKDLDNKSALILASALDGIYGKFMTEGTFNPAGGTPTFAMNLDQLSKEQQKLMADPAWHNNRDVRHNEVMDKNKQIMETMRKMTGQK